MFIQTIISIFILTFFPLLGFSSVMLEIRIYSTVMIQETDIMIFSGKYELMDDKNKKITDLYKDSKVSLKISGKNVAVYKDNNLIITTSKVKFKATGFLNTFQIIPDKPAYAKRIYDDNIIVSVRDNSLLLINKAELEKYIAGVVQSEGGGSTKDIDFFFVQAITCRTYALNNIRKHNEENFHLCDDVHCQAYYGRCTNSDILMASFKTAGEVIVDTAQKMISAAFHSNSGGQTMNSEDVWSLPVPYLRSIKDTFSLSMSNTTWQKEILTKDWLENLEKKYSYPIHDDEKRNAVLNFQQQERKVYLADYIHLKDIRADWNLRSTFFSVIHNGDTVLLDGKGFGHGIGMSQQGAIRMIKLGYSYIDVIHFYYTDVSIVNFENLDYFFINYKY